MSSDNHMGSAVRIISTLENGKFVLDEEALSHILLNDLIRDKPVVVISVAGDFRKGKSFLLNLFLLYLQSGCQENWLDDVETPLKGFSWKAGNKRDTTGLLMWSQPFIIKGDDGRDVAILLLDTQGIFGTNETLQESSKIYAMSTLISSLQIYNLMRNLQEKDLQNLDLFTIQGQFALDSFGDSQKPFQKLMFLIRDWNFLVSHEFGLEGGNSLLKKILAIGPDQQPELQGLRKRLNSSFKDMNCYLMPNPGKIVTRSGDFYCKVADIDSEFIQYLKPLVSLIFDPSNLEVKVTGGQQVTAKDLFDYIKAYIEAFASESMPESMTFLEAMAEVTNRKIASSSLKKYVDSMKIFCGSDDNYLEPDVLKSEHDQLKAQVIEIFDRTPKIGSSDFSAPHREWLIQKVEEKYIRYEEQNNLKNTSWKGNLVKYGVIAAGAAAAVTVQLMRK